MTLVERKTCCRVKETFSSRLELTWPISSLEIPKMSKKCIFAKTFWESMGQGGLSVVFWMSLATFYSYYFFVIINGVAKKDDNDDFSVK